MAQLFDIKKVTVGPRNLVAVVEVAPSAPHMTSEDPTGTDLVLNLMPELADHVCLGDSAPSFGDVIAETELAHLLEHVTVELLARTDLAGDVSSGQTVELDENTYQITFACPDDVLVAGALSSAVWVLQWAYSGGGDPQPDIEAIEGGLVALVQSLDGAPSGEDEPAPEPVPAPVVEEPLGEEHLEPVEDLADPEPVPAYDEPASEPELEPASEPEPALEPAPEAPASRHAPAGWDMDDVPRPRLVR